MTVQTTEFNNLQMQSYRAVFLHCASDLFFCLNRLAISGPRIAPITTSYRVCFLSYSMSSMLIQYIYDLQLGCHIHLFVIPNVLENLYQVG